MNLADAAYLALATLAVVGWTWYGFLIEPLLILAGWIFLAVLLALAAASILSRK